MSDGNAELALSEARRVIAEEEAKRLRAFGADLEALCVRHNCELRAIPQTRKGPAGELIVTAQIAVVPQHHA